MLESVTVRELREAEGRLRELGRPNIALFHTQKILEPIADMLWRMICGRQPQPKEGGQ